MSDLSFEEDVIHEPRRSARRAWTVAGAAGAIVVVQAVAIAMMLPLKQTQVFTVLVDKNTGQAEQVVQVQPTDLADKKAVREALLVSYVTSRETYFPAGSQQRLETVERMSADKAKQSLIDTWTDIDSNKNYPPRMYGPGAEVHVKVLVVNWLTANVAQVRLTKTLERPHTDPITRSFVATVEFEFKPEMKRELQFVWENPLGFLVTNYAVDAETLTN